MKRLAWLMLLVPMFALAEEKPARKDVGVDEFEKLTKQEGVVILDVRTPREHGESRIKGCVHINIYDKDFDKRIAALDKSKTYAVYCAVGMRSAKACDKLAALGFANTYSLSGGMKAWQAAGKPVEK